MSSPDVSARFALDAQSLGELRLSARRDPQAALEAAARQFEALFMNLLLKSMREATPQDGPFDSEQTRLYTSMLDQQLAQNLSSRGVGLAEIMIRQLTQSRLHDAARDAAGAAVPARTEAAAPSAPEAGKGREAEAAPLSGLQPDFVNRLLPDAQAASRATGIPAHFMLGQAALESGWGQRELRGPDGAPSYNLFGIKAGRNWNGAVVEAVTTEYVNGVPHKTVERFRAYASYAEGFRDYAGLLKNNPRYAAVLESGDDATGFAWGLQQAGYATDPRYAEKLVRILRSEALRQTLAS